MRSHEHLIIGGPSIDAWPTSKAGKLRPGGGGGGGGDGGAAARRQEEERQARVRAAVDRINAIFNGADTQVVTNKANQYVPGQTLYNADGTVYVAPTKAVEQRVSRDQAGTWSGGGDAGASFNLNPGVRAKSSSGDADMFQGYYQTVAVPDAAAINKDLQEGLYTGVRTVKGSDRNALYRDQQQAVTELNQRDVQRQFEDAERQNRFGLARAGLAGGSVDVDSNAEIDRINSEGLMKAVGIGQAAASDLRSQDERTRQNLISMAQSGIDTGQAAQLALSGLDANAAAANSARSGATIGNLFGDLANAYAYNQQMQAFNQGMAPYQDRNKSNVTSTRNTYAGVGG